MKQSLLHSLRIAGLIEGSSFLILLFIAMPMKYALNMPLAVTVVGWVHGVLFMLYCGFLLMAQIQYAWSLKWSVILFIIAFIPFGPFIADRRIVAFLTKIESGTKTQPRI